LLLDGRKRLIFSCHASTQSLAAADSHRLGIPRQYTQLHLAVPHFRVNFSRNISIIP